MLTRKWCTSIVLLALLVGAASAQPKREAGFEALVDAYFTGYFGFHPSDASAAGFHQYDGKLENYSRASLTEETAWNRSQLRALGTLDRKSLSSQAADDLELLVANIHAHILASEQIRLWEKDPDFYLSGINGSVFILAIRNSAPLSVRLKAVIEREREMPKALIAAHRNLRNPPRIYTEIALENIHGIISFFENDLPLVFKEVPDSELQLEFRHSNEAVLKALREFQSYLAKRLLPVSHGDYRIGAENFREKLRYEEMVDLPLSELMRVGIQNLRQNQEEFRKTAARIDPNKTPQQILAEIQKEHPPADQLLDRIRGVLGGLQKFIVEKRIITIPSDVQPQVRETPPFMRSTTTASMDTPGPYNSSTDAFYFATLPDPTWPKEKVEDFMGGFTFGTILSTSIHEAYPGHYTQFLWIHNAPSKVRKLISCSSNAEGWAHYTEQMMLDEGFADHDPKMRLGQLQDALLRNARYIAGLRMHTGTMTYRQAIEFFVREGYQSHEIAVLESKRGTSDPTYMIYTLGKLAIIKLREDYRKMKGDSFTLQEFHDQFMKQGAVPIKLIRRALLHKEGNLL